MAVKNRGLGRGLDALLANDTEQDADHTRQVLSINLLDPNPDQPRKDMDPQKLSELTASIKIHGVLQPLLVTPRSGRYMIIAGERRFRASREAGLSEVPVIIREMDNRQIAEVALVENLQRDDLNPVDEAMGIRSLLETFSLSHEQVGERLGMSRPAVTNSLRLLTLPENILDAMRAGRISAGHGRVLAGVADPDRRLMLADLCMEKGMSVRELEDASRREDSRKAKRSQKIKGPDAFEEFEDKLMQMLGTRVHIEGSLKKGKIIVDYFSRDDLERIYEFTETVLKNRD